LLLPNLLFIDRGFSCDEEEYKKSRALRHVEHKNVSTENVVSVSCSPFPHVLAISVLGLPEEGTFVLECWEWALLEAGVTLKWQTYCLH